MAPHFDLNVIEVGRDGYSGEMLVKVDNVIERARGIFSGAGLPIGTVRRFQISVAKAGLLAIPDGDADCRSLTHRWAVPNDALDVFLVPKMVGMGRTDGFSPRPALCDKRLVSKKIRTAVVSLQHDIFRTSVTFAHEIGHCLRLLDCQQSPTPCGPQNVMDAEAGSNDFRFTGLQVEIMKMAPRPTTVMHTVRM